MARIARVVVPGLPHHVTQRGNRRERVFFEDDDYAFIAIVAGLGLRGARRQVCAYCLMPNHVHLILTPDHGDGLARALSRRTAAIAPSSTRGLRQTGHLFQSRFGSVAMDEDHLMAAARYVALNPVRAGLAGARRTGPVERARALGRNDGLVRA